MIFFVKKYQYSKIENLELKYFNSKLNIKKSSSNYKCLVYTRFFKIIGYLSFADIYDNCDIHYFLIKNKYQKKGFGKKIFNKFLKYCKKNNIKNIFVEVSIENTNAIKFYKKFNFIKQRIIPNYYNNTAGILMKRG